MLRFGLRELLVEAGLDLLALGFGLGLGGVARLLADRVGLGLGLGQFLLVGGNGGVGLFLHAGGLVEILGDAVARTSRMPPMRGSTTFFRNR